MKSRILCTSLILFALTLSTQAQTKVTEKKLLGNWKLVIELDEAFDQAKKELEDEDDNIFAKMIISSVSGLVEGVLDEIDIYMNFQKDGTVEVITDAYDDHEEETTKWHIDSKGRLYIDDTESYETDGDNYWMFKDDILICMDEDSENEIEKIVYMVRVDK